LYGQKHDLNAYLAATPGAPRRTIAEIVAFNSTYKPPMKYGQAIFEAAQQLDVTPGSADTLRYQIDLAEDRARSRGAMALRAQRTISMRSSPRRTTSPPLPRRRAIRASPCPADSCRRRRRSKIRSL